MTFVGYLLMVLLLITALFLIVIVLVQRGKGGGLAGAFGGMGGQSAFGTKAGDLFTRVTVGLAAFWIILCIITAMVLGGNRDQTSLDTSMGAAASAPADQASAGAEKAPAGAEKAPAAQPAAPATGEAPAGAAPAAAPAASPTPPPAGAEGDKAKP